MVTLNHIMLSGMCMVLVILVTSMKQRSKPTRNSLHGKTADHKTWEESHFQETADCNRVIKLDCIGHVQKRLGKALYEFQSSSTKLADGKPLKGRDGRLTKKAIEKLKKLRESSAQQREQKYNYHR